ncbi:MAG: hypothetical protein P8H03_00530, partial [Emcibacteraceae bacterium]|nr:hypothetical protein [Emcibacteraceae bacterium]
MKLIIGILTFLFSTATAFAANDLGMDEPLKQGGFYVGKIAPGDKVTFHGERVKISEDGFFVIGLGWKYKATANIRVDHKAGGHTMHHLDVKPHVYDTEEISGLPAKYVAPPKAVQLRISRDAAEVRKARTINSDLQNFKEEMIWPVKGRISGRFG